MKKTIFDVRGMSCAACQAHVQKAAAALPGVRNVNVNLLRNTMELELDESQASIQTVCDAVEKAGYSVCVQGTNSAQKPNAAFQETSDLKRRLLPSLILLLPLAYLGLWEFSRGRFLAF